MWNLYYKKINVIMSKHIDEYNHFSLILNVIWEDDSIYNDVITGIYKGNGNFYIQFKN